MARSFDPGSSQYLFNNNAVVAGTPVTIAAWIYPNSSSAFSYIATISQSGQAKNELNLFRYQFDHASLARKIAAQHNDSAGVVSHAISTAPAADNTWSHACAVFTNNASRSIFLNGSKDTEGTTRLAVASQDVTAISAHFWTEPMQYWDGDIAEAAIWNAALTDDEVATLAKGYSPLFVHPQNLVAYWPLIRDEDQDRVGGYDMTPQGGPTIAAHVPVIYPVSPLLSLDRSICTTTVTITATVTITVTAQQ